MKYLFWLLCSWLLISSVCDEKDYTDFVKDLADKMTTPRFKHSAYARLGYITDTFGPRMWGSTVLELVIK